MPGSSLATRASCRSPQVKDSVDLPGRADPYGRGLQRSGRICRFDWTAVIGSDQRDRFGVIGSAASRRTRAGRPTPFTICCSR